ncbi:VOC family protein [Rhodoferax aquaticus]|uniref:VOC family protein n=1 Tax=Rhodoferax aquaticus TaxID=2527691 RepID=A0A515EL36_9BURK|nr:VOC family protein [Rhodoferax aquaticus]QDL53373.1 VOC family protein [Rhodoferax aquaticus]
MTSLRFDHIVVAGNVNHNAQALRAAGLVVEDGGRHEAGLTHNLLAALDNSSYVELIDFSRAWLRPSLRLLSHTPFWRSVLSSRPLYEAVFLDALTLRGGPITYAYTVDDLESFVSSAASRGLVLANPVRMSRLRPDGVRIEWSLAISPHLDLPFFLQDHTAGHTRLPETRPKAPESVRVLQVAVSSVKKTTERYVALFDTAPSVGSEGTSKFQIGGICVEIVQGKTGATPSIDCELCSGRLLSALLE